MQQTFSQAYNPNNDRMVMAAPKNPMDKSTIVSISAKPIRERKETITPGLFELPAGSYDNPAVLVVGSSSWWLDRDPETPILEIPDGSVLVAKAIVDDYCKGLVGCDMINAMPGLFWVPGAHTAFSIKKDFRDKLDKARAKQINWYKELIKHADIGWAKSNANPIVIMEEMKIAATELGFMDKPWMKDKMFLEQIDCPACMTKLHPQAIICATCKAIVNPALAKEKGIKFAE